MRDECVSYCQTQSNLAICRDGALRANLVADLRPQCAYTTDPTGRLTLETCVCYVPPQTYMGSVNLNAAATDLNAQIVGASVAIICGFVAIILIGAWMGAVAA